MEGLSVGLLTAQSTSPDWELANEVVKILMDRQQLVEYDRSVMRVCL